MQVHTDIAHLPGFNKAVVTIGTFDGVHTGHRKIIAQMKEEAGRTGGETVIISFHPHPRKVIAPAGKNVQLITTIGERIELLDALGIDHFVIVPFTQAFSELSPEEYVEDFLIAKFRPAAVIIGYDHKFGRDRKGDYRLLESYSHAGSFELKEIPPEVVRDNTVSSTLIREAIRKGDMARTNMLLGYDFFFEGTVVHGDHRGRTIGFPTANLQLADSDKIVPGNGVYAVIAEIRGEKPARFKGMMNIGFRPTVGGQTKTTEVNIFGLSTDIYGMTLRVTVVSFLREEKKFAGIDELKRQLETDKARSMHQLGD